MKKSSFGSDEFALKVVAKGSYIDTVGGDEAESFLVETAIIRMNHIALNEWILSSMLNCRDTYETDEEWEAYKVTKKFQRKEIETKIINALGIEEGSACITQTLSEIFTVVCILKIAESEGES